MRDRLLRDGFVILAAVFVALRLLAVQPWVESVDAYAYWTTRSGDPYAAAEAGRIGAYLYSPAFAQLLAPLVLLPWPVFCAAWTALLCFVYWRLVGRLALPLLTKVTPGIGLLWFAVRREWRSLGLAVGATVVVSAVSFVVAPDAWRQWLALLVRDAGAPLETPGWYAPIPLLVRLPVAAVVVTWGALTDRRWTVPVAVVLSLPIVWLNSLAILAALPALGVTWPVRTRAIASEPAGVSTR